MTGKIVANKTGIIFLSKSDAVRIIKGRPNAKWPTQQVDYVKVTSGGKVLDRNGNPILDVHGVRAFHLPVDIDFWIKGVDFPQMRGRLIIELLALLDSDYQEKEWFGKGPGWFGAELSFVVETFEDLQILNAIDDSGYDINEDIGLYYKSKREADAAVKIALVMQAMLNDIGYYFYTDSDLEDITNEQYRNSKYLTPLREAAKEAYDIFMENEKDNKEFLDFIEKVKELREKKLEG